MRGQWFYDQYTDAYEWHLRSLARALLNSYVEETAVVRSCSECAFQHFPETQCAKCLAFSRWQPKGKVINITEHACSICKHGRTTHEFGCALRDCHNRDKWELKEGTMDLLEAFLGDFVNMQKGGVEAVHICRKCGTPNLSINIKTGLWQCWCGCGSGKADPSQLYYWQSRPAAEVCKPKEGVDSLEMAQAARTVEAAAHGVDDIRRTIEHLYRLRHPVYDGVGGETPVTPADVFMHKNQLCMALRNREGVVCGWQSYDSNTRSYRIHGGRGIVQLSRAQTGRLILTEGFWDAISMQRIQPQEPVVCSCGATLSDEQLSILVKLANTHGMGIVIAFDNDRLSLAARAHSLLSPYVSTLVHVPPHQILGSTCKDWDDVYAQCGLLRARSVFRG